MDISKNVPATKNIWRMLAISGALIFAYATVLVKLGQNWWTDENYSHGLLIPFVIGYFLWSERDRLGRAAVRPSTIWGLAAVVVALLALWAGTAGSELYLQRTSLVLMLAGTVLYFWGFNLLRLMIVPLFLLVLAIPIPSIIFNKIAFPLQLFASRCAVAAMTLFDIPVLRQGNVIELMPLGAMETKKLEVVEACSGIRSLMTLLTLAVVFAYFTHPRDEDKGQDGGDDPEGGQNTPGILTSAFQRLKSYGFWRSAAIVCSAVPIAIFTNALRVSGTGVLARYYGTKVADGFFHSFSGWVIYIVAFLMLFGVGWLLDRVKPRSPNAPDARATNAVPIQLVAMETGGSGIMKSWRFAILFVLLVAGGLVVNAWEYLGEARVERQELKGFPKQVGTWAQTGGDKQFDNQTMAILKASDYLLRDYRAADGRTVNFYVGYYASQRDGATYHSPLNCLPGAGWVMSEPGTITISPKGKAPFVANRYLIQNGDRKDLLVYWYQGRGRSVASEYWGKIYTVLDSVSMRRSDGAMVRITTPVTGSEPAALQAAADLAAEASTILPEFIPD